MVNIIDARPAYGRGATIATLVRLMRSCKRSMVIVVRIYNRTLARWHGLDNRQR